MSEESKIVLYSGNLGIDYGQFYIDAPFDEDEDFDDDDQGMLPDIAFEGSINGLVGSALSGKLFFVTGIQGGIISIEVELHACCPSIDDSYTEIVEVPFTRGDGPIALCEWGHTETHLLDISPGNYRVRYCIEGMERDYADDGDWDAPVPGQRHLIQLWPSALSADQVVKLTAEVAAYWHREWGSMD